MQDNGTAQHETEGRGVFFERKAMRKAGPGNGRA